MSDPVNVYAGNQGDIVPVAGRTDGDGNIVQLVDVIVTNSSVTAAERWVSAASSDAITALDEFADIVNCNEVLFQITGTFVGTLVLEISVNGVDWVAVADDLVRDVTTGLAPGGPLDVGVFLLVFGAWIPALRVRASAWTSGTADVTWSGRNVTAGD